MTLKINLKNAFVSLNVSIRDALYHLDKSALKLLLVTNERMELLGTISDGDIRRGILKGFSLEQSVSHIVHKKPIFVRSGADKKDLLDLMIKNKISQVPVLNYENKIVDLILWDELISESDRIVDAKSKSNYIVMMAGGFGKRLVPITKVCPKPMIEIDGKPMLEHILSRAVRNGFVNFIISTHYLSKKISDYFGNGVNFGANITYAEETYPLGTAGALGLVKGLLTEPFLVTNGDVLTEINYGNMLDFHIKNKSDLTMAVSVHKWQNPYGVVELNDIHVIDVKEKPMHKSFINAGVYVLNPTCLELCAENEPIDMTEVIKQLIERGCKVIAYPIVEKWVDVGRHEDLLAINRGE